MKLLLWLTILSILIWIAWVASAAELQASLNMQMSKQEGINKKNTITTHLALQAQKRKDSRDRFLALQYQRLTRKNNTREVPIMTQSSATPILTITRPPVILAIQIPKTVMVNQSANVPALQNVDMSRVRWTWMDWYNAVRQGEWVATYSYDTRLDVTAYDWNQVFASAKGQNHHRRNSGDSYYSFATIDQWFISRGINPKVINRAKHTENVGYGYYSCHSNDCTDTLIRSIRSTFDFFMSEKWKAYDAHYRSIVQPYFSKIGLSIIVVPEEKKYYLTVHYITE